MRNLDSGGRRRPRWSGWPYTVDEARAALGGVSRHLIYEWIKSKQLGPIKVGGRRFITAEHMLKFLADHEDPG
jgi:excisionase family DNA binding protein